MQKINSFKLSIILIVGLTFGCQKNDELFESVSQTETNETAMTESSKDYPNGTIVLGKQLENPYDLEVMQKAYDNLVGQNPNGRVVGEKLVETHLYIKFLPDNEKEYQVLKTDSTLILYNYPLDYEIKTKGNSYQDPTVPIGKPTYQYCAVETKKSLPKGVKYKVLAKLYIPKDSDGRFTNLPNGRISDSFSKDLEIEAFKLTNNLDDIKNSLNKNARIASYRPAGKITIWDDSKGQTIGVEGVEVRARRWFTTHIGHTDVKGEYSCDGTFVNDANYSIEWERYQFEIRDGWLSGACYEGPKQSGDWNLNLDSGVQMFYARIFRASFRYYYKDIENLKRPPLNSFWATQMHIRAHNEDGRAFFNKNRRFLGLGSAIHIYSIENGSNINNERLFYIAIHELAHASHWELRKNNWTNGTDDRLVESWAMGVGWVLTRIEYSTHNDYANMTFAQMRDPSFGNNKYTPVIIDLLDNDNQGGCCSTTLPIDVINGYTIKNIEDVLSSCSNLQDLRNMLTNTYEIPQEAQLNAFFAQYINL